MTTSLLLHFDGDNDSTTFTDVMGKTVTPNGDVKLKTAEKKFGTASGYFDGNNDYLSVSSHADFGFGTGDFTVEFWLYRAGDTVTSTGSAGTLLDGRVAEGATVSFALFLNGSTAAGPLIQRGISLYVNGVYILESTSTISTAFTHVAVVRASGTSKLYINGVEEDSSADSNNYPTCPFTIGGRFAATSGDYRSLNGYIDELRITKGTAIYTAAFTPPTAPLLPESSYNPISAGISSTAFGTPAGLCDQLGVISTGIASTAFGAPYGMYPQFCDVSDGIATTVFGEAEATQSFTARDINCYVAQSIRSTTLGTPTYVRPYTPVSIASTRFGTPAASILNRTGRISDGINSTAFGTPVASLRINCLAGSIANTTLGTPAASWSQTGTPTSIHNTTFGIPTGPARGGRGKSIYITQRPR